MAATSPMDVVTNSTATTDLEIRIACIADPNTELRVKHVVACEIREMLETVRDSESSRALPYLVPAIIELLRSGEPVFLKDSPEYLFRRVLFEILHRLPVNETIRSNFNSIFNCMLHVIRTNNEEDGATACKILVDIIRNYRALTEDGVKEFVIVFQAALGNMPGLVEQFLSENSESLDANTSLPAISSCKVIGEMGMVMVIMSQMHKPLVSATLQSTTTPAFEMLSLESPIQHKARVDYEAMGNIWSGTSPSIKNTALYSEFIHSQIKMLSYLAYVMRFSGDVSDAYGETLVLAALRLLQDCPANGIALRKELMVVFRHLMGTPHRKALFDQLDKLFDENVLLGSGVASKEMLRPVIYSAIADLVHHVRGELNPDQLQRVLQVYSSLVHNPSLPINLNTTFLKMMFGLTDVIHAKMPEQEAKRLLLALFDTCLEKLEGLCVIHSDVCAAAERNKTESGDETPNAGWIEKSRPVGGSTGLMEKPEEVIHESRVVFRALLHGFRVCLASLKKWKNQEVPDGIAISRLFEGCIRCMSLFDLDPRLPEQNESLEWLGLVLLEVNLHVFQEVWTREMEFFFESAQKRLVLLGLCQVLFTRESTSPTLLAIVLQFLMDRLPSLGDCDDVTAVATIRLYKMAFGAVSTHPSTNEAILAAHVGKLLMDCFPLAAKATKPTNYFHLLRALFRAIGVGGGRYELLYNAVLPLLPDMLESLNSQLLATDGQTRDMIVELCLTVPLRLTHLLPHLTYLMQPLALALKGNSELVSQGLRTLELCIDNLTPDFLDPTLSTVLRDLMEALFNHLKPLPAAHHPAHTTIRILGKLGGRNRRLLTKEPALSYRHHSDPAKLPISFNGRVNYVEMGPVAVMAARGITKMVQADRLHAYNYLESTASILLHEGIQGRNVEETFVSIVEGLFDAIHIPETQEKAEAYIYKLGHAIFEAEIARSQAREPGTRLVPGVHLSCFLDAIPHALSRDQTEDAAKAQTVISNTVNDVISLNSRPNVQLHDVMMILHQLANRFAALCLDESWVRKSAGYNGIKLMTQTPELGARWVTDRELELFRTLLHILKDLPSDLPRNVEEVTDVLTTVLRISTGSLDFQGEEEEAQAARTKVVHIIGVFFPELQSPNVLVREAAQKCINLLVSLSGRPAVELLMPHRDRTLVGIFTKPLRALPFSKQIGMIEAIRYCVSLDPPLVELNDELLRLLHETLALADAEDVQLVGPRNVRQGTLEVIKLRVACIKLLTASMPLTDFFSRQHQTRQRVTSVYFKSLYSPSSEVKDVAHEGLRMVLIHQQRLPKELLQTGLRPILMNLADPKRLSVPGLEGLARLLELLTNYFKVEIGHKLLDHYRIVADPAQLTEAAKHSLKDDEAVTKLVRLANIFHLLPSAANIFLEQLVNAVVATEATMHFSSCSPFSEPLARYLDRYFTEGVDYLLRHLSYNRAVRTVRSILQAKLAPNLLRELSSRTPLLVNALRSQPDPNTVTAILGIFDDLSALIPTWIAENGYVLDAVLELWNARLPTPDSSDQFNAGVTQLYTTMISIFKRALSQSPRIDLLFDFTSIYTVHLGMDLVGVTKFVYQHTALSEDTVFKRNILMRFLTWFTDGTYSWTQKTYFIRFIVSPVLLVHAKEKRRPEDLINPDFVNQLHRILWQPMNDTSFFSEVDDLFKIEILHLTTILVQYYHSLLDDVKKDIMKLTWSHITSGDDVIVKQTAYLLAAHFFASFTTPQKFILRAWTGLLRTPQGEGRAALRYEALSTLAPSLPKSEVPESGHPPSWAKTTRRLLAEEGLGSMITIYHLMVKQPHIFFPVRSLFVPHIANSLNKLGMAPSVNTESRLLSIEILQAVFKWEEQANQNVKQSSIQDPVCDDSTWLTPLGLRENMVSYLVRLATVPHEPITRTTLVPKALALLQLIVGPNGWSDVTVGLRFFSRALELNEIPGDNPGILAQALSAAKVLQVIAADQPDSWYTNNAQILNKLVRKGLLADDTTFHDALLPIFDQLIRLYPLPKEEEEQATEMSEFHAFIYSSVGEGLRNSTSLSGILGMLKSIVKLTPERIEPFSQSLMKLLSKFTKEHIHSSPSTQGYEAGVRLIMTILDICQLSVAFLGDQRRWLLSTLCVVVDKSKSPVLCRYTLDLARNWALHRQEAYPTMKEKATLLQKMTLFESRGESIFTPYLELIYEIYTEPTLRRSDLTNRLEQSFLLGCRAKDSALRERFMDLLDVSVPRSLFGRLTYILGVQNWEALADHNWIYLALYLLLGAADVDPFDRRQLTSKNQEIGRPPIQSVLRPMQRLLFLDTQAAHDTWVSVFPAIWSCLSRREQADTTDRMVNLLSKDFHVKQAHLRPNIVQTLLTGIHACSPPMTLPPHLVKYLAKTFCAWHIGLEILEASSENVKEDELTISDYIHDSLADVYAELAEEDLFYGLWRRRSIRAETNIGLAFEQAGMWEQALNAYETAMNRVRTGTIPFSETEFCLWEDHWIDAAEKLQHWDILYEFAKSEDSHELVLECTWRTKDWNECRENVEEEINHLSEFPTPRRRVFEAYLSLLKNPAALDKNVEFTRFLEDAMQLSLRKWIGLPQHLSAAHIPLLQHFQQFVELQEAVQIFGSLSQTNAQNLEKKSSELKMVLQAWRERLPNVYDDINIWSDLVAWRQNVFGSINAAYMPLITNPNNPGSNNTNTFGYRGYHETAWIINRFAHVARKHELLDVCFNALTRIYTLPNIEISEAFLKLREQARAHYQKPNDLQAGLEVINNTNLMFFSTAQKAEFYTLKGMFHSRLGRNDDATLSFGQAVQLDMSQPKAWAEWGRFSDRTFKENPTDLAQAANAVSCYLQAAGLYKNGKSRPLLARILWLLSLDDNASTISRAFDTYKGDAAFWFWITFIPQLTLSLSQREWKQARYLLLNLARHYPQAIFYHLRTSREEIVLVRKALAARAVAEAKNRQANSDQLMKDANDGAQSVDAVNGVAPSPVTPENSNLAAPNPAVPNIDPATYRPGEYVDEILQTLKTTFPLLILSLETMVDQIQHKFKPSADEDIYRTLFVLLSDAIQNYVIRINSPEDDGKLTNATTHHLMRMCQNIPPVFKKEFDTDFITSLPTHNDYIKRLQKWRAKFETILDARPRLQPLALLSNYLTEFQYSKIDEIEVPGQYTEDKDSNQTFVRILKFAPKFENCRSNGSSSKRFTLYGHDNTKTSFTVQLPCLRQYRREERFCQIFRTFNGALTRYKESRKRNLLFHLPPAVTCSPNVRLYQTDSSYVSMADIYDIFCDQKKMEREEPIMFAGENLRKLLREYRLSQKKTVTKIEYVTLKKDLYDDVSLKMVPDTVLSRYMALTMNQPEELWRMRKQFALQIATTSFMTYLFSIANRWPARFLISRSTGLIAMSDLLPGFASAQPVFATSDVVPFRLTPNMQQFLGKIFTEGILAPGIMAIGRALTEPEFDLEQQLCLLSRDEVTAWISTRKGFTLENALRASVTVHIENIVKRAETMACKQERDNAATLGNGAIPLQPVIQTVTSLISTATNPIQLAKMGEVFQPWL